jgi:hypothetical protein
MTKKSEFTRCRAGQNLPIVIQSAPLFDIVNAGPKDADDAVARTRSCIMRRRRETGPDHFNTLTQGIRNESQLRPADWDKGIHPQGLDVPLPPQKQGELVNAGMSARAAAAHPAKAALLSRPAEGGGW